VTKKTFDLEKYERKHRETAGTGRQPWRVNSTNLSFQQNGQKKTLAQENDVGWSWRHRIKNSQTTMGKKEGEKKDKIPEPQGKNNGQLN